MVALVLEWKSIRALFLIFLVGLTTHRLLRINLASRPSSLPLPNSTTTSQSSSFSSVPPPHFRIGVSDAVAQKKWAETLLWRAENGIDRILSEPPKNFALINEYVPLSHYTRDKQGNLVVIEKWGSVNMVGLKQHSITADDVLRHYMFQQEWLWTIGAPKEQDLITLIMDVGNVTVDQLTPTTVSFVQRRMVIGCDHYPNRDANIVVLNVPSWWQYGWSLVSHLVPEHVKSSVSFVTNEQMMDGFLNAIVNSKNLSPEYGGTSTVPFGKSPTDVKQQLFVDTLISQDNRRQQHRQRHAKRAAKTGSKLERQRQQSDERAHAMARAAQCAAAMAARKSKHWWQKSEGWTEFAEHASTEFKGLQRRVQDGLDDFAVDIQTWHRKFHTGLGDLQDMLRTSLKAAERDLRHMTERIRNALLQAPASPSPAASV